MMGFSCHPEISARIQYESGGEQPPGRAGKKGRTDGSLTGAAEYDIILPDKIFIFSAGAE